MLPVSVAPCVKFWEFESAKPCPGQVKMPMTMDEAVLWLRQNPRFADYLRNSYLETDTRSCAERFRQSGEFAEVRRIAGDSAKGVVLDLGAGNGIASYAFAMNEARLVCALEPDPGENAGRGAIHRLTEGLAVEVIDGWGEEIPLLSNSVDMVYARQVLHHTRDLRQVLRECARVLKRGGAILGCREHVVDNDAQLRSFLRQHPIHQLLGNESAFRLEEYLNAIRLAGIELKGVFGPWDSVINAFPGVVAQADLEYYPIRFLQRHLGAAGTWLGKRQLVRRMVWRWLKRPVPGRLYTFLGVKS